RVLSKCGPSRAPAEHTAKLDESPTCVTSNGRAPLKSSLGAYEKLEYLVASRQREAVPIQHWMRGQAFPPCRAARRQPLPPADRPSPAAAPGSAPATSAESGVRLFRLSPAPPARAVPPCAPSPRRSLRRRPACHPLSSRIASASPRRRS